MMYNICTNCKQKRSKTVMGNISIKSDVFRLSNHRWQTIIQPNSQLMMLDLETGIIAHAQPIKDLNQRYIDSLEFRTKYHRYLVDVLAIIQTKNSKNSANSTMYCPNLNHSDNITVLIENINYRLPDLGIIKYNQGIYILHQCLQGIKTIFSQYKNINVQFQEQMIGFNKQGQCKIWLNANYFKDIEQKQMQQSQQKHSKYKQLINQLIESIEGRMSYQFTKMQHEQYYRIKQMYCLQDGFKDELSYIENCNINSINFETFRMEIGQTNETNNNEKLKYLHTKFAKNHIVNINKMSQRSKISLKRRASQSKKDGEMIVDKVLRSDPDIRKRNRQTILFSSNIQRRKNDIIPKYINKSFIRCCDHSTQKVSMQCQKQSQMKFSRISLMTKDSQCSKLEKYMENSQKGLMGMSICKKLLIE